MSTWTDTPAPRIDAPDLRPDENAVRVLLVESSSVCVGLVIASLEQAARGRFDVECADCLADARHSLSFGEFDAVLIDLTLAGESAEGVDAVSELAPRLPVVAVAGIRDAVGDAPALADEPWQDSLGRIDRAELPATILRAVHRHRRLGVCRCEPTICRVPAT